MHLFLVWSMESAEHMPDKAALLRELVRIAQPGGRIIVVTWCHRELKEGEVALKARELRELDRIRDVYYLPPWVPLSTYVETANAMPELEDVRAADWTEFVAPFWSSVIGSVLKPRNLIRVLASGSSCLLYTSPSPRD